MGSLKVTQCSESDTEHTEGFVKVSFLNVVTCFQGTFRERSLKVIQCLTLRKIPQMFPENCGVNVAMVLLSLLIIQFSLFIGGVQTFCKAGQI